MTDSEMIGHYRIVGLIGTGAMGKVHRAVDTFLEREVAIKSLRAELTQDPDFVGRFKAEATNLARLNHPNITTLYSPVMEGSNLFMVMELVHGRPLDAIMTERAKPLPVKESLAIIAQAADGLAYAHQIGVIHRDVKPSNVMVADDGRVKIMDFGIARVRDSVRMTRAGTAVGTPLYMSPEQCRGGEGDERSDQYSLSILLYELLSGAPPFAGATEYDLTQQQIHAEPSALIPRVSGVTPEVEAAVMKALSKRPEQRFPNMRAFSDALGATALRIDATNIIKSAAHLLQDATSERDVQSKADFSTKAIALAKSRAATLSRRFRNAHPVVQGATLGVAGAAAVSLVYFAVEDSNQPTKTNEKKQESVIYRPGEGQAIARVDNAPPRQGGPCNPTFASLSDSLGCNNGRGVKPAEASSSSGSVSELRVAMKERGQWDAAFALAQKLSEAGDKEAQFHLGTLYLKSGARQNFDAAYQWLRRSADQGYADAQVSLGLMYRDGITPEKKKSLSEMVSWFQKAAAQNNPRANYWLGRAYENGVGSLPRDSVKAEELYTKAMLQDFPEASSALEQMKQKRGRR